MNNHSEWDWEIKPKERWFRFGFRELIHYKDLLFRFVRRDIIASYQQTILGPAWVFLQPLITTFVYFLIFSGKIKTDPVPPILFYLPGTILWTFFSDSLTSSMYTFRANAYIFGKVYFPRLILPASSMIFHGFRLLIQLGMFLVVYACYAMVRPGLHLTPALILMPLTVVATGAFALGAGLVLSVVTARYRDLDNIFQFLLRLFMFVAPVLYPISFLPARIQPYVWLNPLTPLMETFRAGFFPGTPLPAAWLGVSVAVSTLLLLAGILFFNRRAQRVMDII